METTEFKAMDIDSKIEHIKNVKNEIIGSHKQKSKYWEDGLIEVLLTSMDELEMSSELLMGAYSIFVCYTNNFEEAYDTFRYQEDFSEKIIDNMTKAIELNEDNRVIDLCMQILRNLLVNNMLTPENTMTLKLIKIFETLVDNNKRINLIAQIISKLAKDSSDVKDQLMTEKIILDSIISSIDNKGSTSFRLSLLDCLVNLSKNHESITAYIRENINIQKLIAWIKYQHNEITAKVAYLATLLNSEKKMSSDFENLIKQIIFQITRMSLSPEIDDVLEATTMLYNLVKSEDDVSSARKALCIHTCEIGATEILAKVLAKWVDSYLEVMRNLPKDEEMQDVNAIKKAKSTDKEDKVQDVTGSFKRDRTIIINILKISRSLMNAHQSCMKKIINVSIPHHFFKLLDKSVGDEIRICTCECLRILARAKKPLKIQIIEIDQDLEKLFKGLINDPNVEIQKLGMAIIWNFSIDFPSIILTFKEFIPRLKEFISQDKNYELKLFSIKTLKNLLFIGHPDDVRKNAEKAIFEWICVKDIFVLLDDEDKLIKEQAELIFKYLSQTMRKEGERDDNKSKSVLENIDDDMMARICQLSKED